MGADKTSTEGTGAWWPSLRLVAVTMAVTVVGYTGLVLLFAQAVSPSTAAGSLVTGAEGRVVGSELIAQAFASERYFWPRPSAVGYNGAGSGGSNLSPAGAALRERVTGDVARFALPPGSFAPADLVTASGSGLDPHLTIEAALFQVQRVAAARGLAPDQVRILVQGQVHDGFLLSGGQPLVNVLLLNLALDRMVP